MFEVLAYVLYLSTITYNVELYSYKNNIQIHILFGMILYYNSFFYHIHLLLKKLKALHIDRYVIIIHILKLVAKLLLRTRKFQSSEMV